MVHVTITDPASEMRQIGPYCYCFEGRAETFSGIIFHDMLKHHVKCAGLVPPGAHGVHVRVPSEGGFLR
jgi:hypothetical protein